MSEFLSSLKLQTFEIFAYLFPGVILTAGILNLFFEISFTSLSVNFVYIVIIGFIVGIILHSLFGLLEKLMWLPYNLFKEKDEDGKGVKDPKSKVGIFALKYRLLTFCGQENGKLNNLAKEKLQKRFSIEGSSNLDQYYIKENQFIQNSRIAEHYAHLSYNKIFSSSSAVSFFILAIVITFKAMFSDFKLFLSPSFIYDFEYLALWTFTISLIFCFLLFRQSIFYKNYRNNVLNVNIIVSITDE